MRRDRRHEVRGALRALFVLATFLAGLLYAIYSGRVIIRTKKNDEDYAANRMRFGCEYCSDEIRKALFGKPNSSPD